jgi:hypothetical protein
MFVLIYFLVSGTILLSLHSATSRPTPSAVDDVLSRSRRTAKLDRIAFATRPQPHMTHSNCLS